MINFVMRLRRLVRFGKLVCVHNETKLEITRVSPPHLLVPGQARYGSIRFVHTAIYSVPCRAVPWLEGSVNGVLVHAKAAKGSGVGKEGIMAGASPPLCSQKGIASTI